MVKVIGNKHWQRWCSTHGIALKTAVFSLDTCYYGSGLRSRPGTLLAYPDRIVHWSYSVRDTLWAIFEPSTKIELPFKEIAAIRRQCMTLSNNIKQLWPDAHIRIQMVDGTAHDLFLQRNSSVFENALHELGCNID